MSILVKTTCNNIWTVSQMFALDSIRPWFIVDKLISYDKLANDKEGQPYLLLAKWTHILVWHFAWKCYRTALRIMVIAIRMKTCTRFLSTGFTKGFLLIKQCSCTVLEAVINSLQFSTTLLVLVFSFRNHGYFISRTHQNWFLSMSQPIS